MARINKKRESGIATPDRPAAAPERDRIAMRAYELYLERGGGEGRELDDWLRAEHEVSSGPDRPTRG